MKKFTSLPIIGDPKNLLVFIVLALAAVPSYGSGTASSLKKGDNPLYNGECSTITIKDKTYKLGNLNGNPVSTRVSKDDVIWEAEGTKKLYSKSSAGTALFYGAIELYKDVFPAEMVWGDNDEVYVKNILSTIPSESYVKGTLKDGVITFQAGQLVDYIEEEGFPPYGLAVGVGRTVVNEQNDTYDFVLDPSITEFQIKVEKNGSMNLVLPGEPFNGEEPTEYILCLYYTDDNQFAGFSDFSQQYKPVDYEIVRMPFGVPQEQYVYIDDFDYASFVNVAWSDDYLYLQGLDPMIPEGVVKAKIDGNTATIAQNQYVGIYMGLSYIFTKVALDNPNYDIFDPSTDPYIFAPADQGYVLTFDRDKGEIMSDKPGIYLSFQPDEDNFWNVNCFLSDFVMKYQATAAGTPANPVPVRYFDAQAGYWGYTDFQFKISNYSTEGHLLDVEHLFYQVLVNGEPIIFGERTLINLNGEEAVAYVGVPEEQRWLPYLFSNDDDITKWSSSEFDVGIYVPDVKTLGVQSLYLYDGVATYSKLMTLDVETGEITESDGSGAVESIYQAEVKDVEYFTLSGVKVKNPQNGIFVKRTIYSDGKVTASKLLMP